MIAFVGSVFSPYYASARRRAGPAAPPDPQDHCAINVALYRDGRKRWAMTERGRGTLQRAAGHIAIGRSALAWSGDALQVTIDETGVPVPLRLRGRITLHPQLRTGMPLVLSEAGGHRWHPVAPRARAEVVFDLPGVRWRGHGYHDANWGDEPLEQGFAGWQWCRAPRADGGAAIGYDAAPRHGAPSCWALQVHPDGRIESHPPEPERRLPTTGWRIGRTLRAADARLVRTLEDTPFYARSLVDATILGEPVRAMHESLSLDRFASRWVQMLLPFRMPRRAGPR